MKIRKVLNEATIEQAAKEYGSGVKKAANDIQAGQVVDGEEPLGMMGRELDAALAAAREAQDFGEIGGVNVLFVGRGGTGKTYTVKKWAQQRGINLVEKDAKTMDPSDLGGVVARRYDAEGNATNTVTKLSNTEFDELDKPNSVLFLDELNRARKDVAGALLTLINDHVINDQTQPSGKRLLKGFLFTIAAINPNKSGNEVNSLDNPMRSRFKTVDVESNPQESIEHFEYKFGKQIEKLKAMGKPERIPVVQGRLELAKKLLSDPRFEFDGDEEEEIAQDEGLPVLNPRSFSRLLTATNGTKESLLANWSGFCNPEKYNVVEDILSDYVDVDDKANDALKFDGDNPFAKAKAQQRAQKSIYDQIADLI